MINFEASYKWYLTEGDTTLFALSLISKKFSMVDESNMMLWKHFMVDSCKELDISPSNSVEEIKERVILYWQLKGYQLEV